jgi:hypothetical protein
MNNSHQPFSGDSSRKLHAVPHQLDWDPLAERIEYPFVPSHTEAGRTWLSLPFYLYEIGCKDE